MRLLLVVLLLVMLVGALPMWPYSTGWGYGYYPSGGLGLLLIIILLMAFFGGGGRAGTPRI